MSLLGALMTAPSLTTLPARGFHMLGGLLWRWDVRGTGVV